MSAKIKNDPARYLTRSVLGGALVERKSELRTDGYDARRKDAAQREASGTLDQRWYIDLPRKR